MEPRITRISRIRSAHNTKPKTQNITHLYRLTFITHNTFMRDSQKKNRAGLREEPSPAGLRTCGRCTLLYIDRVTEPVPMTLEPVPMTLLPCFISLNPSECRSYPPCHILCWQWRVARTAFRHRLSCLSLYHASPCST